jgi:hypothetical protein
MSASFQLNSILKSLARRYKRNLVDPALLRIGYELWPVEPEWRSRPLSARETKMLLGLAAETVWAAVGAKLGADKSTVQLETERFFDLVPSCPVIQNHGGSGFNAGLLLYVVARILNPGVIIESGVFRGFTTWVMRLACPRAKLYCFDLTFRNLSYRDDAATYIEHDWSECEFGPDELKRSLCFFDDHVDQWQRIEEAAHRGVGVAIFDDSFSSYKIHSEPNLAFPSAAFLSEDSLLDEKEIEWCCGSHKLRYAPDVARALKIKGLCKDVVQLPPLFDQTGYKPAALTLVEIL